MLEIKLNKKGHCCWPQQDPKTEDEEREEKKEDRENKEKKVKQKEERRHRAELTKVNVEHLRAWETQAIPESLYQDWVPHWAPSIKDQRAQRDRKGKSLCTLVAWGI